MTYEYQSVSLAVPLLSWPCLEPIFDVVRDDTDKASLNAALEVVAISMFSSSESVVPPKFAANAIKNLNLALNQVNDTSVDWIVNYYYSN